MTETLRPCFGFECFIPTNED